MTNNETYWIAGRHAVFSAIKNSKRKVLKIYTLNENHELKKQNINYKLVSRDTFKKIVASDLVHQNISCEVTFLKKLDIKSLLNKNKINILLLDNITDPRNIGSIIRSACAFGIEDVIVKKKDFKESSQVLNKSSSGALDAVNIYQVTNLNNTIEVLKKNNFFIYGLDSNANTIFSKKTIDTQKNVFVLGSEGKGLSHLTKKKCDKLIKLEISNKIESLNVSNAISAFLYGFNLIRNS